jgi:hypothetical protein
MGSRIERCGSSDRPPASFGDDSVTQNGPLDRKEDAPRPMVSFGARVAGEAAARLETVCRHTRVHVNLSLIRFRARVLPLKRAFPVAPARTSPRSESRSAPECRGGQ